VLWFGRSVRTQILIVVIALSMVAASVAGGIIIYKAGVSTRIEIAASMRLADLMVNEAVQLVQQGIPAEPFLRKLPDQMRFVRHVRVRVTDAAGQPLADPVEPSHQPRDDGRAAAPAWFAMLIGPPVERHVVAVAADGRSLGTVEIVSEPHDEIAEVWGNTVALGAVAVMTELSIIVILYLVLGRVLDPLRALGTGLRGLEQRNYKVRLTRPRVREFAVIADRFNALAGALDAARTENLVLNRHVITAQDDERRRTALELHDEVGPSLFGLKANIASLARILQNVETVQGIPPAAGPPAATVATMAERVGDLAAIVDHLQGINRGILNRLRPMALGNLPLPHIIAGLVRDRAREHPHIAFTHDVGALERSYDDTVDLTVYRCVQESLTNAIRHANAKTIEVRMRVRSGDDLPSGKPGFVGAANSSLPPCGGGMGRGGVQYGTAVPNLATPTPIPAPQGGREYRVAAPDLTLAPQAGIGDSLELTVRDDGFGFAAGKTPGFGLRGMQERVQALGGEFAITAGNGEGGRAGIGGACVRIVIPLPPRPAASSEAPATDLAVGLAADSAADSAPPGGYASTPP
jgi:two-component system sensor histidine kinase UhpB